MPRSDTAIYILIVLPLMPVYHTPITYISLYFRFWISFSTTYADKALTRRHLYITEPSKQNHLRDIWYSSWSSSKIHFAPHSAGSRQDWLPLAFQLCCTYWLCCLLAEFNIRIVICVSVGFFRYWRWCPVCSPTSTVDRLGPVLVRAILWN
jgi:hypothetical protein